MKRAIIVSVALLASGAGARADYWDTTDYDLVRPHGRPRSEAVHQAAVAFCTKQTGENPDEADTPVFKRCLLGRGYRVQSEHLVHTPPAPTPVVTGGLNGAYVYDDASPGPLRSDKDEQAATRLRTQWRVEDRLAGLQRLHARSRLGVLQIRADPQAPLLKRVTRANPKRRPSSDGPP